MEEKNVIFLFLELAFAESTYMILAILNGALFLLSLLYVILFLRKKEPLASVAITQAIRISPNNLKSTPYLIVFSSFLLFLLLPLTIGLSIYLRSDANVLVVILWIVWTYNWIKYAFWRE